MRRATPRVHAFDADASLLMAAASNDQQRGQPRRRQVDQIVESCGGKPEVAVTRRAMADHAVGGVDRLVGRAAGQAADRQPEHRRDDSVGEILREAFDRRPRDAGLVERVGIAPDDLRHRLAAAGEAFLFERRRDALDMVVEAALGNQRAGDERQPPRTQVAAAEASFRLHKPRRPAAPTTTKAATNPAASPPAAGARVTVERRVERPDHPAEPHHRMADRPQHAIGIAECCFDQQGQ